MQQTSGASSATIRIHLVFIFTLPGIRVPRERPHPPVPLASAFRLPTIKIMPIAVEDLGRMPYRQAWARQEQVHADVVAGANERILLVEHPPVITCGRRPSVTKNLLASPQQLEKLGLEFVESDRGGDITFHGPGQLVAYPIIRLIDHHLSVGGYVRVLEQAVISALGEVGIA